MNAISIKKRNINLVINALMHKELISQNEIAQEVNISIASVGKILKELKEKDIVVENTIGESSGGRKPLLYSLVNEKYLTGVFYINKNSSSLVLMQPNHQILVEVESKRETRGVDGLKEIFNDLLDTLKKKGINIDQIRSWGVIMPGIISLGEKKVIFSRPLNIQNIIINSSLLGVGDDNRIFVFQDADAYLLSYQKYSSGKRIAFIYINDGLGFSLINDNNLQKEEVGGLEIGHTMISHENGEFIKLGDFFRFDNEKVDLFSKRERNSAFAICVTNIINMFNPSILLVGSKSRELFNWNESMILVQENTLSPYFNKIEFKMVEYELINAVSGVVDYINNKDLQF